MTDDYDPDAKDQLLRDARRTVVDDHAGTVAGTSRDYWGRHGFWITAHDATMLLCAKATQYGDLVSFSKPVLASALERGAWLLLWDDAAETLTVYDPEWVRETGTDATVASKRAEEIGVKDVPAAAGIDLTAFKRGDRPPTTADTRPTLLEDVD